MGQRQSTRKGVEEQLITTPDIASELSDALYFLRATSTYEILALLALLRMQKLAQEEDVTAIARLLCVMQIGGPELACAGPVLLGHTYITNQRGRLMAHLQRLAAKDVQPCLTRVAMGLRSETSNANPIQDYHTSTSLGIGIYSAVGPAIDWSQQPSVFRRYPGAAVLALPNPVPTHSTPRYRAPISNPSPLNLLSLSTLLHYSLGVSGAAMGQRYLKRVNPSSGCLHPVEVYIVVSTAILEQSCMCVHTRYQTPILVMHYAPLLHALEIRGVLECPSGMEHIAHGDGMLVCLTSVDWRELWKYGERGYRYSQLDVGHAMASVCTSSSMLGWKPRMSAISESTLRLVLGLSDPNSGDFLNENFETPALAMDLRLTNTNVHTHTYTNASELSTEVFGLTNWVGGGTYVEWIRVGRLQSVCQITSMMLDRLGDGPSGLTDEASSATAAPAAPDASPSDITLGSLLRRRRSAVDFTTSEPLSANALASICAVLQGCNTPIPIAQTYTHANGTKSDIRLSFIILLNNSENLEPGIYMLAPGSLTLTQIQTHTHAYMKDMCASITCGQTFLKQAHLCVCVCVNSDAWMDAEPSSAGMYRYLHWAAGARIFELCIEAEALGLRACPLGCFLDDEVKKINASNSNTCLLMCGIGQPDELTSEVIQSRQEFVRTPFQWFHMIESDLRSRLGSGDTDMDTYTAIRSEPSDYLRFMEIFKYSAGEILPPTSQEQYQASVEVTWPEGSPMLSILPTRALVQQRHQHTSPATVAEREPSADFDPTCESLDARDKARARPLACSITPSSCRRVCSLAVASDGVEIIDKETLRTCVSSQGYVILRIEGPCMSNLKASVQQYLSLSEAFFQLTSDMKSRYTAHMKTEEPNLGYVSGSRVREYMRTRGCDPASPFEGTAPSGMRHAFLEAYGHLHGIARVVFEALISQDTDTGTHTPPDEFFEIAKEMSSLSCIRYFTQAHGHGKRLVDRDEQQLEGTSKEQEDTADHLAAEVHEDTGIITMGVCTGAPGLQVWDRTIDAFVDAQRLPEASSSADTDPLHLILFLGKKLGMFTGEPYRATPHRVCTDPNSERMSLVFLYDVV